MDNTRSCRNWRGIHDFTKVGDARTAETGGGHPLTLMWYRTRVMHVQKPCRGSSRHPQTHDHQPKYPGKKLRIFREREKDCSNNPCFSTRVNAAASASVGTTADVDQEFDPSAAQQRSVSPVPLAMAASLNTHVGKRRRVRPTSNTLVSAAERRSRFVWRRSRPTSASPRRSIDGQRSGRRFGFQSSGLRQTVPHCHREVRP